MKYSMKCACGDMNDVEAENRPQAVQLFKDKMTQEVIDEHMAVKHPDQPGMTMAECHAMIEKEVTPME